MITGNTGISLWCEDIEIAAFEGGHPPDVGDEFTLIRTQRGSTIPVRFRVVSRRLVATRYLHAGTGWSGYQRWEVGLEPMNDPPGAWEKMKERSGW